MIGKNLSRKPIPSVLKAKLPSRQRTSEDAAENDLCFMCLEPKKVIGQM